MKEANKKKSYVVKVFKFDDFINFEKSNRNFFKQNALKVNFTKK